MQQFVYFIQKSKYLLFFLLLVFISLTLTINNHNFHKSKFISSANAISGGLFEKSNNLSGYLHLKDTNIELVAENLRLKNQLQLLASKKDTVRDVLIVDSTLYHQKYTYSNAKIIKNNYHTSYNFLTINKGENQEVFKEMAVVNGKGIIGITENTSSNYTRVQSILNKNSKINARLKNSFHFGTLTWNGNNYNTLQLIDIPRQATITVGDTVITGGKSTIFPEGILIGTISKEQAQNSNTINVTLFNDMSNLGDVYIIKNLYKNEILNLENNRDE